MFNIGKYLISGIITILAIMIFMSTAYAQCGQSATLDFTNVNVSDIFVPNPVLSNCSVTPQPLQVSSTINSADPVTVNFTGGKCTTAFPFAVYASLDLYDEFGRACPGTNGFTNQLQFSLSRSVRAVLFQIGNATSTSQTYTVTSDAGDIQQLTIAAQSIGNVQIQPANVANVINSITVSSTVNDPTRRGFAIGYVTLVYIDTSTQAGTITALPSAAESGANVTIFGTDWKNGGAVNSYRVLLDNMVVANGASLCFQQPTISFNIPCGTALGTHTVTSQLINTATQQVLGSSQTQIEVTGAGTNCPCTAQVGNIAINPNSGIGGDEVTLIGSGWNGGNGGQYQILFDGIPLTGAIQQVQACTDQPNIKFNIPCSATTGQHFITCQLGSLISSPLTFNVVPSLAPPICATGVTFKFDNDTVIPEILRIGISTTVKDSSGKDVVHNRTLNLKAVINSETIKAADVMLKGSGLDIKNRMDLSDKTISFQVEAQNFPSGSRGDRAIKVLLKKDGSMLGMARVSVIIPGGIGIPHEDTKGMFVKVKPRNILASPTSNPPIQNIPANMVKLVTIYAVDLTIKVLDQWNMDPVGDLYEGAVISEIIGGRGPEYDINKRLASDSTYVDPVGAFREGDIVRKDSQLAKAFIDNNIAMPLIETTFDSQKIDVKVDGFLLRPSVVNRTVFSKAPNLVSIEWPNK